MVCLGLEPRVAGWKAQMNPLSYGGTPFCLELILQAMTLFGGTNQGTYGIRDGVIQEGMSRKDIINLFGDFKVSISFDRVMTSFCLRHIELRSHFWYQAIGYFIPFWSWLAQTSRDQVLFNKINSKLLKSIRFLKIKILNVGTVLLTASNLHFLHKYKHTAQETKRKRIS